MLNQIKEYIKLIPKGLKNFEVILEGVVNQVKLIYDYLPEDEQEEIIRRRLICKSCKFISTTAIKDPMQNYKTDRFDEHCSLCECNIELKTASLESKCGIQAFNIENPNNKMELKWETYKKQ